MFVFQGAVYKQAARVKPDTEAQRYAAELYEKLIRIISTKSGVAKMRPFPQERLRRKMERGMVIPGHILDPILDDIDIVVVHRPDKGEGHLGAGGYINLNRATGRYEMVLGPDLWGEYELPFKDAQDARGYFDYDTFTHELTHYFDIKRWKGGSPFKDEETEESEEDSGGGDLDADYYNNSLEFNAFFQAGAHRLNSYFEWVLRKRASLRNRDLRLFALPFEEFAQRAIGWFRSEWIRLLNKRNQRAFLKRLYNMYIPMNKRAVEILEKTRTPDYSGMILPSLSDRRRPKSPYPKVYEGAAIETSRDTYESARWTANGRVVCECEDPRFEQVGMKAYGMSTIDPGLAGYYGVHIGDPDVWLPTLYLEGDCDGSAYIYTVDVNDRDDFYIMDDPHPMQVGGESWILFSKHSVIPPEMVKLNQVVSEDELYMTYAIDRDTLEMIKGVLEDNAEALRQQGVDVGALTDDDVLSIYDELCDEQPDCGYSDEAYVTGGRPLPPEVYGHEDEILELAVMDFGQ